MCALEDNMFNGHIPSCLDCFLRLSAVACLFCHSLAGSAVWHDPADAQLNVEVAAQARLRKLRSASGQQRLSGAAYERALRRQHAALHPRTDWAKLVTTNQVCWLSYFTDALAE
jgi:hypothetical protein